MIINDTRMRSFMDCADLVAYWQRGKTSEVTIYWAWARLGSVAYSSGCQVALQTSAHNTDTLFLWPFVSVARAAIGFFHLGVQEICWKISPQTPLTKIQYYKLSPGVKQQRREAKRSPRPNAEANIGAMHPLPLTSSDVELNYAQGNLYLFYLKYREISIQIF
jgi:hypothetical protein